MNDGWLKIYRKLTDWEWYTNSEMVHLFLHLILKAAPFEKMWRGIKIERGQVIIGRQKLSAETGISEMKIRTCLSRLQLSGEITIESSNRFSIVTICKYDDYQPSEDEVIQQSNQQSNQQNNQPVNHNIRNNNLSLSPNVDKEVKSKAGLAETKKSEPDHKPGERRILKNGQEVSLMTRGQEVFMAYFYELFDEQYQWKPKDSVAMKRLLKTIENSRKSKNVPLPVDDDSLVDALDKFIRSIEKDWILENFTVTVIDSQYNNIITQIKNSRKNGTKNINHPQVTAGTSVIDRQRAACVDDIAKADELYFKQMRQQGGGAVTQDEYPVSDNE